MPQMAPLNWILLYWFFLFIFTMIIIINYFNFFYTYKTIEKKYKKMQKNWSW
uniref:ATP synthase complex subunit 8 n=1 Tax=Curculionoidea sp. 19 KM-2017 TaxID=2219402 RepID=A0A346RIN6_9CUCU|nr:ATP synthase F0 subunit 8 [Curculionoidea sp. 19 KM-2017]